MVGCAQAFGGPAYSALVPMLVEKEDLPNAIALNSIQFNLARVIGPMLGGLALTGLGAAWCFGLNGLSFVAVIISLLMLTVKFVPQNTGESILTGVKQGIGFIRKQGAMVGLIVLAFLMTALAIPMLTFLPVFAKDVFHRGPTTFTILLSCSGAGSVAGALIVAAYGNVQNKGQVALLTLLLLGGGIAGFALSKIDRVELRAPVIFGRGHDGGVLDDQLAGATDHRQRNARARDERLQRGFPRRHAAGQPGDRMAGADLHRAARAGGEWPAVGRRGLSISCWCSGGWPLSEWGRRLRLRRVSRPDLDLWRTKVPRGARFSVPAGLLSPLPVYGDQSAKYNPPPHLTAPAPLINSPSSTYRRSPSTAALK